MLVKYPWPERLVVTVPTPQQPFPLVSPKKLLNGGSTIAVYMKPAKSKYLENIF